MPFVGADESIFALISAERPLVIASRKSPLAQRQARIVREMLARTMDLSISEARDCLKVETFVTQGDRRLTGSLAEIGGKGLFTKEIEDALLGRHADIAVHSMKDMPAEMPKGLMTGAVPQREDPRDAFISTMAGTPWDMPEKSVIGTSSVRRAAQLLARRPDLKIVPLRGNVGTRLEKLKAGQADGTFLAEAGLQRLENDHVKRVVLDPEEMLPAAGQGVLCIQIRQDSGSLAALLSALTCRNTAICSAVERGFLTRLDGSCQTPIAGLARLDGHELTFQAQLLSLDGVQSVRHSGTHVLVGGSDEAVLEEARLWGVRLAEEIYAMASPDIRVLIDR